MQQILLNGLNLDYLLERIGELIEKKLTVQPPKISTTTKYLSRLEVSTLLKISLPTLNEWTKLGWLKSYKIGNRVLYQSDEVEASLQNVQSNKHKKFITN
jgi:excisionase family DNA binding protein